MTEAWKTERARREFPATTAALDAGELYVHCPRCEGERQVFAYTHVGNGFTPSRGEYFNCPLCSAMGEAEAERAAGYIAEWADELEHS